MLYGYLAKEECKNNPAYRLPVLVSGANIRSYSLSIANFYAGMLYHHKASFQKHVFYQSGGLVVVISGSVYNAAEIQKELGIKGEGGTPEFIAGAFEKWGQDFVKRLNGDFAIGIYKQGTLYLFRDHLGVCPLFYSLTNDGLFFSGDDKALCRILYPEEPIEPEYLLVELKTTNSGITPNKKVKKLPPGSYLKVTNNKVETIQYWFPEAIKVDRKITYPEAVNSLRYLVANAVKIRCDESLSAAAHLSGGLDSGLISALGRMNYPNQKQFLGFSYSPSVADTTTFDLKNDERLLVEKIGKFAGITPVFTDLSLEDYEKYSKDYYNNTGSIWEERICEIASERGISVIFSGWGGDEFISKGQAGVFFDLALGMKWKTLYNSIMPPKSLKNVLRVLVLHILFPALGITWKIIGKAQKQISRYIKKPYKKTEAKVFRVFYKFTSRRSIQFKVLKSHYFPERCEKWYLLGLRHGITYRYPLLDYRIVEYVLKLPSEFFVEKDMGRMLIREIASGLLPEEALKNTSKFDDVLFHDWLSKLNEFADILIPQVSEWEVNPDLHFIDFPLLRKDISVFTSNKSSTPRENMPLLLNIQAIKKMHEFTRVYRSPYI